MLAGENDGGDDSLATRLSRTHPFWTLNSGWVDAVELQPGDACMDETGRPVQVLSTEVTETTCTTYNLTVAGHHSYFVNKNGVSVLVHNTNMDVPRQWIVYAMEVPQANNTTKWYIGRASMPSDVNLNKPQNGSPKDVFHYRGGPDGSRHHVWRKFGQQFAPAGQGTGVNVKILDSFWANSGATATETALNNKLAKERCMAIERHCVDTMTNNWTDTDALLNTNRPLARHPNQQLILTRTPITEPSVRKTLLRLDCP